jgi:hypothetical protein
VSYIVASWYTPDYAAAAKTLAHSLDKLDIPHIAYECIRLGNWYDTVVHWKPRIVQMALDENPGVDIVYTDSDSVFHSRPPLFDNWTGADLGLHYLRGVELLGGTQYWSNTPKTRALLDEMSTIMAQRHTTSQLALAEVLWQRTDVTIEKLPPEYCFIFDTSRALYPGVTPIVEHFQHSRRARMQ